MAWLRFYCCFTTILLVSACGGGSSGSSQPTSYESDVVADPTAESTNTHPLLRNSSGDCLNSVSCASSESVVTKYSESPGFIGHVFGLGSTREYSFTLDPQVGTSVTLSHYSGPVATYSAKHYPTAVASERYTYFVFTGPVITDDGKQVLHSSGGGDRVSSPLFQREDGRTNAVGTFLARYNHASKKVSKPLLLHAKHTDDPHDNAVLNFDNDGNLYVLIAGREVRRSSLMFFIESPDQHSRFAADELIIRDISPDNLDYRGYAPSGLIAPPFTPVSYPHLLNTTEGLRLVFTLYCNGNHKNQCAKTTRQIWSAKIAFDPNGDDKATIIDPVPLAAYQGHYFMARVGENRRDIGLVFNYHPEGEVSQRTNLYYLFSNDAGESWQYFHPDTGEPLSAQELLPLTSPSELKLVAALEYDFKDKVKQRIYLKDLHLTGEGSAMNPAALFTLTSGAAQHEPTLSEGHRLMLSYRSQREWQHQTVTDHVDHNYSTGFLFRSDLQEYQVFFPGTRPGNGNAMAGGVPASVKVSAGASEVEYYGAGQSVVGENHYLTSLCEMNYARSIKEAPADGMIGIAAAANPYQFIPVSFNSNMPSAPLMMVDGSGTWYRLPLTIRDADQQGEVALTKISRGEKLNCDDDI
ncbi:hypothetical protein [Lacimicrobium sp. SS2-24]|uniref:hypothetical protein n=1 Tax=Lacimicrobium sp. SS2-24 TaxID=2005569 RepID=UPI00113057FD|nr:hypothetical protein [Lacimicrobium sp. SS2-24]